MGDASESTIRSPTAHIQQLPASIWVTAEDVLKMNKGEAVAAAATVTGTTIEKGTTTGVNTAANAVNVHPAEAEGEAPNVIAITTEETTETGGIAVAPCLPEEEDAGTLPSTVAEGATREALHEGVVHGERDTRIYLLLRSRRLRMESTHVGEHTKGKKMCPRLRLPAALTRDTKKEALSNQFPQVILLSSTSKGLAQNSIAPPVFKFAVSCNALVSSTIISSFAGPTRVKGTGSDNHLGLGVLLGARRGIGVSVYVRSCVCVQIVGIQLFCALITARRFA